MDEALDRVPGVNDGPSQPDTQDERYINMLGLDGQDDGEKRREDGEPAECFHNE